MYVGIIYTIIRMYVHMQGSAQTIFSGGNLVSLGVGIFAMYLYTPPQFRLTFC